MDQSNLFHQIDGNISDAMGHLRDGNYELAENLLQNDTMRMIETLREPDCTIEKIKILRKLSVIYEYQDRVDECHDAWAHANALEKRPKFGANPHPGWNLSPPPSAAGYRKSSTDTTLGMSREELGQQVQQAEKQIEDEQTLLETHVAANERYIASILAMAREDQKYSGVRRILTAGTVKGKGKGNITVPNTAQTTTSSVSFASPSTSGNNTNRTRPNSPSSMTAAAAAITTTTTTTTISKKRPRKKKKSKKTSSKKTQTIDELKKLIKQDPTIAGLCALKMARKYTTIRQPKKALQAYKKALMKEKQNFINIEEDQKELLDGWSKIRGMREKREAEELKVQLASDWIKSESIIVNSHVGLSKLLLTSPIAALNAEVVVATMPSKIEEARTWYPYLPKNNTNLKSMYCAAPLIEEQCRQLYSRYPITKRPIERRKVFHQTIEMLNGCVAGPLGDLFGELIEELLETNEDGDDLNILDIAGKFYTRRRHFRRANEILVRSEALRRGEIRSFVEPRRSIGTPLLTFGKHLDPSIELYLKAMPDSISGNTEIIIKTKWSQLNTTKSIDELRSNLMKHGESGTYGVASSDTWRGNLVNCVNPGAPSPQDAFVIRTTVGRSKDELSDNKSILRSVGVSGQLVPTAGSSSLVRALQKGDLKSSKIPRGRIKGGGPPIKWRDELNEKRRRKGHSDMWQHHSQILLKKGQKQQGVISTGSYDPEGIPKRHWLEPSKLEKEARQKILEAAGTAGDFPPPSSAAVIAGRLSTAESRTLQTSELAKKFGSNGLGETQRLQNESRARVFELPPPVRNPLQTPGTRATLSSRGGMAFWMDDVGGNGGMSTVPDQNFENSTSFPGRDISSATSGKGNNGNSGNSRNSANTRNRKNSMKNRKNVNNGNNGNNNGLLQNKEEMPDEYDALDFLERPPTVLLPSVKRMNTAESRSSRPNTGAASRTSTARPSTGATRMSTAGSVTRPSTGLK